MERETIDGGGLLAALDEAPESRSVTEETRRR
jgi:hypothetical protein